MTGPVAGALTVLPVTGIGEVAAGDDLAALLLRCTRLVDDDVLVVTSKAVSKAEGRVATLDRDAAVAAETERVVARRGRTTIARTRHGLVMAAAGVDASNTRPGTVVLLPVDADLSARRLRRRLLDLAGANVAVVVSDTSGRAWRTGQTDVAVGAAGLAVLDDHAGRTDPYGNVLAVTAPAVADEVAGAADLVTGKLSRSPAAVLRGLADRVLPVGEDGPGARALIREESTDMFGLGAREAVVAAAEGLGRALRGPAGRGFGAAATEAELRAAVRRVLADDDPLVLDRCGGGPPLPVGPVAGDPRRAGRVETLVALLARAHGWEPVEDGDGHLVGLRPGPP